MGLLGIYLDSGTLLPFPTGSKGKAIKTQKNKTKIDDDLITDFITASKASPPRVHLTAHAS